MHGAMVVECGRVGHGVESIQGGRDLQGEVDGEKSERGDLP